MCSARWWRAREARQDGLSSPPQGTWRHLPPHTPPCTLLQGPCCHDALSAKLIEQAGFPYAFMSGFCTAGARLGAPDTGLISYAEMLDTVGGGTG